MPVKVPWDTRRPDATLTKSHYAPSDDLYHTPRWNRLSRMWRDVHPLCENCKKLDRLTPSTCVDHIIPMPICRDFFYEETNLQALCDDCNRLKGIRDKALIKSWSTLSSDQKVIEALRQVKRTFK